jgi:hypothetical protein
MHLPSERQVVNGVGLGEVDGLFNIGKAFKRFTTIKKSSFKLKNIMGAIGSATMFTASGGLSVLAPKLTGAHSKLSRIVGIGATAVAAGAGAIALAPAGTMAAIGSGAMTGLKAIGGLLPMAGKLFSGGGGGAGIAPQAQYAETYGPGYDLAAQQYAQQVEAQRAQMYMPGMVPDTSYMGPSTIGQPGTMQTSYGDLRSPYTAITEDGQQVQIDPATGEVAQSVWANPAYLGGGAVILLLGMYMMQGEDKK